MMCLGVTLPIPDFAIVDCTSSTTNLDYFYMVQLSTVQITSIKTLPIIEPPGSYLYPASMSRSLLFSQYNTYRNIGYIYRVNAYNYLVGTGENSNTYIQVWSFS
jgi:hypothetical protein